ncbi:MAG: hypothetical protein MSA21_10635, partial [Lachnospiraceae bacterium]|nr:hypothetical protein [Lachnospiraceae bacterium]
MTHSKTLKRALAFLMVIVIMFVTIFTDNVVKRVLVRAGDNTEAGNGNDGEGDMPSASPSANPSAAPSAAPDEDETQYPVLGEDINNSATYCNNSNGEINILLDLDKLSDDAVKADIENAGDIAGVKYKINNTEYDALKKNDNDNKKWIITIPAYAEENKSEDVTYVINRIVVNDTIEISEYENYSLNVTRNTLAPTIKVMCGDEELINDANKVSNDNIELNVKAVDNNGDELISADDDSKNYKVEYLSLKDNGEEMAEKPEIRENTDKGGFDIVLPKKDNETHKYELTVNVKELVWGNSGKISVTAVIDNAIPKIKVNEKSSDNSGKRVFEVTVTDDRDLYSDFEADKDSLNNLLSVLDDNESAVTDADISAEAGAGNNIVKYNVSINNDKVYSIKAKDLAGNESAITKLDAFELNDLKGLSETETTYIGKDGKVVSFTLSGEVSSVRWGIENNAFSDISCDDNNKFEFNVGDKIAGIADANTHSVDIVITKEDGNTIEKKFNIIVDKDAPQFGDINNLYTEWTNSTSNPVSVNIKDNFNIEEISVYNAVGKIDKLDVKDKVDENSINIIKNADNDIEVSVLSNVIKDNSNIVFVACDKAGNKSTKSCYIKKDTNAPNGNISISEKEVWSDLINKDQITFGIYKNSKQAFKLGFADDASGVKEVYYFISKDKNIVSDLENVEWNS